MKNKLPKLTVIVLSIVFIACSSKKETAASIAQEWCNLNEKVYKASDGAEKDAAKMVRKKFENSIEEKYKDNKEFMDEVGKEVEKCEDASEGR